MTKEIPRLLSETPLGTTIVVQIFDKEEEDSINPESLLKGKGKLQGYIYSEASKNLVIHLEGMPFFKADLRSQVVEIYPN